MMMTMPYSGNGSEAHTMSTPYIATLTSPREAGVGHLSLTPVQLHRSVKRTVAANIGQRPRLSITQL